MHLVEIIDKYKFGIFLLVCSASFQIFARGEISIDQAIELVDNTQFGIEITKPAYRIGFNDIDQAIYSINTIQSGIEIANAGYNIGYVALGLLSPTASQQLVKRVNDKCNEIKKAEEDLIRCVSQNAYNFREKNQLPNYCKSVSDFYAKVVGFEHLNNFNAEFNAIMKKLPASHPHPPQNESEMGTGTKIVIGAVIVVGATGAFLVCAPILFPGTVAAAKATAITAGIKAATAGAVSKGSALVGADTALQFLYETKEVVEALPLIDKLGIAAKIVNLVGDVDNDQPCMLMLKLEEMKQGNQNRAKLIRAKIEEAYGIKS